MSVGLRSDPAGGRAWVQVDGVDVLEVTTAGGLAVNGRQIVDGGANANGEYVRWSDGSQVCWGSAVQLSYNSASQLLADWTFPAAFVSAPGIVTTSAYSILAGATKRRFVTHVGSATTATTGRILFINEADSPYVAGDASEVNVVATGRWY